MSILDYLNCCKKFKCDENGNIIYEQLIDGLECWYEYDDHGVLIHYKDSEGNEKYWNSINTSKQVKCKKILRFCNIFYILSK